MELEWSAAMEGEVPLLAAVSGGLHEGVDEGDLLDRLDGERLRTLSQGLACSSTSLPSMDSRFFRLNRVGETASTLGMEGREEKRSLLLSSRYCLPSIISLRLLTV